MAFEDASFADGELGPIIDEDANGNCSSHTHTLSLLDYLSTFLLHLNMNLMYIVNFKELPALNFDLSGILNGAFIKSDGML
jgi:hypothetical protein